MADVANLGSLLPPLTGAIDPSSYKKSLESSLQAAKLELQQNVDGNVANIVEGLRLSSSFLGEVNALRGELSGVQKTAQNPDIGLGALVKAHNETKQNLMFEIRRKTLAVDMGRHLMTAKDKMKLYDDKIAALNWTAASEALQAASTSLHAVRVLIVGAVDPHQSHEIHQHHRFPKVYHILRDQWKSRVESMRVTIASAVDRIVEVTTEGGNGSNMSISIRKSTDGRLSIFELFRCVVMCNLLDTACNTIASAIEPFLLRLTAEDFSSLQLEPERETSSLSVLKISNAISPKSSTTSSTKVDAAMQLQQTKKLFKNTVGAFTFLWKHFSVTEAVPGAENAWRRIAHSCFSATQKQIIKHCLAAFVPDHSSDLVAYQDIVKETDVFETQLFDAKLIPAVNGQHQDHRNAHFDPRGLSSFAKQVDVHFAQKSRKQIIDTAREILLRDNALMESVVVSEIQRDSVQEHSLFEFPSCRVRKVAVDLIHLVDQTLKDAIHQTPHGSESMYQCVRAIFDLYRAIVPVQIKSKEDDVPILSLLVHNDCMYLAHQMLTLAHKYKFALPAFRQKSGEMTFLDLIIEYRRMGEQYFFQYMQAKRRDILQILSTSGGLADTTNPARRSSAESALQRTQHELSRIGKLLKDILPANVFHQSFGALVNVAASWIVDRVQEIWDIGAEETNHLAQFCNTLSPVEDLFTSDITDFVPIWSKMKNLGSMLQMAMVDIVAHFNDGKLWEFTPDEIEALIRAIFSDSTNRKSALKLIKRK